MGLSFCYKEQKEYIIYYVACWNRRELKIIKYTYYIYVKLCTISYKFLSLWTVVIDWDIAKMLLLSSHPSLSIYALKQHVSFKTSWHLPHWTKSFHTNVLDCKLKNDSVHHSLWKIDKLNIGLVVVERRKEEEKVDQNASKQIAGN